MRHAPGNLSGSPGFFVWGACRDGQKSVGRTLRLWEITGWEWQKTGGQKKALPTLRDQRLWESLRPLRLCESKGWWLQKIGGQKKALPTLRDLRLWESLRPLRLCESKGWWWQKSGGQKEALPTLRDLRDLRDLRLWESHEMSTKKEARESQ